MTLGERTREEPHWWQDPRAALPRSRTPRRPHQGRPGGKAQIRGQRRALQRRAAAAGPRVARCIATIPAAQRKLVTTHDALGAYADRYGLEVIATVIPSRSTRGQASAGETAELVRAIERERVPAVFAERSVRSDVERRSPARPAPASRPRSRRTRSARRGRPARPTSPRWSSTRTRSRALSAATSSAAPEPDAFSAPYMQRALVEILLLAVLAGVLGAWIVLRRLAFFTHSVGTATFPVADRSGSTAPTAAKTGSGLPG